MYIDENISRVFSCYHLKAVRKKLVQVNCWCLNITSEIPPDNSVYALICFDSPGLEAEIRFMCTVTDIKPSSRLDYLYLYFSSLEVLAFRCSLKRNTFISVCILF